MKQMLLPGAEELSADAPLLVQTQLGLVGFGWPPLISSWTPLGGRPLRPSARTMQSLLWSLQMTKFGNRPYLPLFVSFSKKQALSCAKNRLAALLPETISYISLTSSAICLFTNPIVFAFGNILLGS